MVLLWFLLALVLLVAALVLLRLDARHRNGGSSPRKGLDAAGDGGADGAPGSAGDPASTDAAGSAGGLGAAGGLGTAGAPAGPGEGDDDEVAPVAGTPGGPGVAPDEASSAESVEGRGSEAGDAVVAVPAAPMASEPRPAPFQLGSEADREAAAANTAVADNAADADPAGGAAADADPAGGAAADADPAGGAAADADPAVAGGAVATSAASSPRLADRVRALLPGRKPKPRSASAEEAPEPAVDPLEDSPVVRWLEEREFEPTPTPAPDFQHGDFAGGLPALGTVSHGVFRGRRALMGVTGGRTVLALQRDTASDVVLDLSRPDVAAEPGFHDAGDVASLEARTSDIGRIGLLDRDRLDDALRDLPAGVRRVWAEDEWIAATLDGAEDPTNWDDAVVALHAAADILAPLPPVGGRARPLPADVDPGAPGAASGPDADPAVGMDGRAEERASAPAAGSASAPTAAPSATSTAAPSDDTPATARTSRMPKVTGDDAPLEKDAAAGVDDSTGDGAGVAGVAGAAGAAGAAAAVTGAAAGRRAGHLRLVPERTDGVRDLSDSPVTADRGDAERPADADASAADPTGSLPVEDQSDAPTGDESDAPEADPTGALPTGDQSESPTGATAEEQVEEPDPFAVVMEPAGPAPSRGDVASDHLEPRPPLARPTRGAGQSYPEDASVPPLAAGANSGDTGIKPLGSEDDEDEIRDEVERFDAARIDGGSDLEPSDAGRHYADPESREVPEWMRPEVLAARRARGGRHRRAKPESDDERADDGRTADDGSTTDGRATDDGRTADERASGRERPGIDPDVEETASLRLPPDIRD